MVLREASMEIVTIKGISKDTVGALAADGWTVNRLATADPKWLERYPGVGAARARRIVDGARELVNRELVQETHVGETAAGLPPAPAARLYAAPPPTPPARMSARVQRILERMRG